jgi:Uma2 family endonuclease
MSTQPAVREWTYAEFARLPDDGNRYEVIAGELYVTPAPGRFHQKVSARLVHLLEAFCQEHEAGEVYAAPFDVIFAKGDYMEPDLVFVRAENTDAVLDDRGVVGTPDLIVEILSDSTERRDRGIKRERYAGYGVPEYWIVDTDEKQVEVYRLVFGELRRVAVEDDALRYRSTPGGPELVIDVRHLFRPANDYTKPRFTS